MGNGTVTFEAFTWNGQYALDTEGNIWEFDELYDHDRELHPHGSTLTLDDCSGALVKLKGKSVWANIWFADFTMKPGLDG
jgi:hypothetical protein